MELTGLEHPADQLRTEGLGVRGGVGLSAGSMDLDYLPLLGLQNLIGRL